MGQSRVSSVHQSATAKRKKPMGQSGAGAPKCENQWARAGACEHQNGRTNGPEPAQEHQNGRTNGPEPAQEHQNGRTNGPGPAQEHQSGRTNGPGPAQEHPKWENQ